MHRYMYCQFATNELPCDEESVRSEQNFHEPRRHFEQRQDLTSWQVPGGPENLVLGASGRRPTEKLPNLGDQG